MSFFRRKEEPLPVPVLHYAPVDKERVKALLARVTYKPDWEIDLVENRSYLGLYISRPGPSSWDPEGPIGNNIFSSSFPDLLVFPQTDEQLLLIIRKMILGAETHEVDEWFRCDGIPVVDPHPELKNV